jgi:hypothetical protein
MKTTYKELATAALAGCEKSQKKMFENIGTGHTRSGASGFLFRKANGRGVRRFAEALKSWADQ